MIRPRILPVIALAPLLFVAAALVASAAYAEGTGILRGTVRAADTNEPLPFANVSLLGTNRGAATEEDGSFTVYLVPIGTYTVQVSYMGYDPIQTPDVAIAEDRTTEVAIELQPSVAATVGEITVYGDRPLVDVRNTSSIKSLSSQDIEDLTIDPTLESVIGQQAGVTVQDGEIHIRGGRADETLIVVDGVALRDVAGGEALSNAVSATSVAEMNILKGGWDAKYGQAISGIIEATIKEGTRRFHGRVSYMTDAYLGNENLDYFNFQLEGPNPIFTPIAKIFGLDKAQAATFHLDLATELSDTYLPSIRDLGTGARLRSGYRGSLFGDSFEYGSFFAPRGDNNWRVTIKSSWTFHPQHKVSGTFIKSIGLSGLFQAHDIGDINRNITSYPWAWSRRLDHHYTVAEDIYLLSLQWRHTLSDEMYHRLLFKSRFNSVHRDVAGKHWSEYEEPDEGGAQESGLGHPYFVDTGDASDYRDRYADLYGLDWELVRETEHHNISVGIEGTYEDVQYFSLDAASVGEEKPLGDEYDLFHVYPSTGSFYIQDRMEYPGINLKIGLRGDVFFPGEGIEKLYDNADRPGFDEVTRQEFMDRTHGMFGRRYKMRWSPRLAVSHPISDRSHIFFNYGRFTQWPTYFYMYAKTGSISSEEFPQVGNPNLDPEVSAQYEFGAGHKFTERFSLRATIFYKDIYDYPTAEETTVGIRTTRRQTFFVYRNLDYARSRGLEIELQKRRFRHTWYSFGYSYSVATGKSGDPNNLKLIQSLGGDARETPLDEQFMWWNRPHKLTLSAGYEVGGDQTPPRLFGVRLPRDWKLSLYWMLQSGEAYSPQTPHGGEAGKEYSKNAPLDAVMDINFSKRFRVGGSKFTLSLQGRNITNHRTVLDVDPSTGLPWRAGAGQNWEASSNPQTLLLTDYITRETNVDPTEFVFVAGSPYRITDINNSVIRALTQTANPAYVAAPRTIRVGLSYDW